MMIAATQRNRAPASVAGWVVAGLESNQSNNALISNLLSRSDQSLPHTLPHIFVNLTAVRFSVLVEKLNE